MSKIKVLYVCGEMTPYVDENKVSLLCRSLPQLSQENECDIRTFMPRFGVINERKNQLHEVIRLSGMNIVIDDTDHQLIIKVASIPNARVQVYFIDNDDYFQRKAMLVDESGAIFDDNDERAMFFARGVIETVSKLRWSPELVHCHDWFSAFMPAYVKFKYNDDPLFASSKIVLSVYDNAFDGYLDENLANKLKLEGFKDEDLKLLKENSYNNLIKFALQYIDGLIVAGNDVDPDIIEFAKSKGVSVLEHSIDNTDYINEYINFYNEILSK
ncbi:MAG: glycogen/starch synthase [Rikenellaceae bacterium]